MSIARRKLLVASVIVLVLLLANAGTIVAWMQDLGVIPLAQYIRSEYVTGTAIAMIMALLILLPGRAVRCDDGPTGQVLCEVWEPGW